MINADRLIPGLTLMNLATCAPIGANGAEERLGQVLKPQPHVMIVLESQGRHGICKNRAQFADAVCTGGMWALSGLHEYPTTS
jgi:hypothetical protein